MQRRQIRSEEKERNIVLDTAKGVAIILVILGHCYSFSESNYVLYWIYGFHMPFFLLVSGMLYGQKAATGNYTLNLKKKCYSLLLPYFVFEVPFAAYLFLAKYLAGTGTANTFIEFLVSIITFQGLHATWFLPCLLVAQLLFYVLIRGGANLALLRWQGLC